MNIYRPQGPFPSLPSGMDNLIKKYFDYYRLREKLPPELEGKVGSAQLFPDVEMLDRWRSWRTGLVYQDEATGTILSGALDELMVDNGSYIVTDYKTRGYDIKKGGEHYYQNQLNMYALLLEKNNMPPTDYAWLVYWIPRDIILAKNNSSQDLFSSAEEVGEARVKFSVELKKVKISTEKAMEVFQSAIKLIEGPMPASHTQCAFCSWGVDFLSD